ncbi:MAG: hypothetical protein MOB07_09715 [Acidobacteria bacterium]|nr:hypothetical protein [Acidobacteriota bacterium]
MGSKLAFWGRYSISPTNIIDPPIFGEVSGPALNGGQLGTAPGRIQVMGIGGAYTFSPTLILDANVGYTRQRIGAEGFDIVSNFGLDVLKIPGTNGPDRLQGGVPAFQINGGWTNIGNDTTGINRFDPDTGKVFTGGLSDVPFDSGAESGSGLFLPRVGIAFRWKDKTVIRGGYGQFADPRPFQDVRNAYPIANIWSMPAIIFNGATNAFIPVTTLRQGLINTSTPPDITQGILALPANTGTTTFPKESMRDQIHSFNFFINIAVADLPVKHEIDLREVLKICDVVLTVRRSTVAAATMWNYRAFPGVKTPMALR